MAETLIGTGTLLKRSFVEFTPASPGYPAHPGVPAMPGYWTTVTSNVCVYMLGDPAAALALLSAKVGYPVSIEETSIIGGQFCTSVSESVYVPPTAAIPPTPAIPAFTNQAVYDYQLGWNARARSIPTMHHDGFFSGIVRNDSIGAMMGFTVMDAKSGYSDMTNAFYSRKGTVSAYEFGIEVQSFGSYPGAVLKLRRAAGKVQYFINATKVREVDATVLAPTWLSAAMYSGGDTISYPVYEEESTGRIGGSIHALVGYITDVDYTTIGGTIQALTGGITAHEESQIGGSLQPLTGYIGKDACLLFGSIQALTGEISSNGVVPTYGIIGGVTHPVVGFINVLTGSVMTIDTSIQALVGIVSDRETGYINGSLAPLVGAIVGSTPGEAFMGSNVWASNELSAYTELVAFIDSTGTITGLMTVEVLHSALMTSTATIGITLSTQAQIEALLQSAARAIHGLLPADSIGEAWVVNSLGMTRYESYDYNSFAKIGDKYYGAKSDGIYLLEGRDDNGTAVEASVNFGNLNFGSINRKALPYLYAGVASDGNLRLKVIADGSTYYYTVRDNTEMLKAQRFELGKGLQASYYDITLMSDGTAFDVTDIEFFPLELKRRL